MRRKSEGRSSGGIELATERIRDAVIISAKGRLTLSNLQELHDKVAEELDRGTRRFLFDMEELSYIDGSGVGELVSVHVKVANLNGVVALCGLGRKTTDLLQITKLYTVFPIFQSKKEALQKIGEW